MAKKNLTPQEQNDAYRDAEFLCEEIRLLATETLDMFEGLDGDLTKITRLQCKSIDRVRKKLLFSKKRLDNAYRSLGKLKNNMISEGDYEKMFMDV